MCVNDFEEYQKKNKEKCVSSILSNGVKFYYKCEENCKKLEIRKKI